MIGLSDWLLVDLPWCILAGACTHWVISGGQTLMHCWLGHRRIGRALYRNHIDFHHAHYAKGHMASTIYRNEEGNNTPYFLIPMTLVGGTMYFILPLDIFIAMLLAACASFYAHVYFDKSYHVVGSPLERFAWFRRKQQLHFVHHLHANSNFAVIDFFWDRLFGTFREPDREIH